MTSVLSCSQKMQLQACLSSPSFSSPYLLMSKCSYRYIFQLYTLYEEKKFWTSIKEGLRFR